MRWVLLACVCVPCALAQISFGSGLAQLQQPSANQIQGTGSITGKVVNGVTGEPIKNATVNAPGAQGRGSQLTTDASGQFQLTGLPAATLFIAASAQAYPGLFGMGSASHMVTLNAGESQSGIILKLYPGGIVSGRIVDDGGDPMSGCFVTPLQEGQSDIGFGGGRFGGSQTNDRGEYRLSGLGAGRYILEARCFENIPTERPLGRTNQRSKRLRLSAWATLFYPKAATPNEATVTVVLPGSETAGIDFQMQVVNTTLLRGRVVASGGEVDDGMAPNCQLVPYNGTTPEPRMTEQVGVDPPTGAFQPVSVLPGNYRLTCSRSVNLPANAQTNIGEVGSLEIHVGTGPVEPVTLRLSPGVPVQGMLDEPAAQTNQTQNIQVSGRNVGGQAQPSVTLVSNGPMFGGFPQGNVDESGRFQLTNVLPGTWTVNVQPRDSTHYIRSITWAQKPVQGSQIEIASGESGPLQITMGATFGSLTATVEGCAQTGTQCFIYAVPTDRKPDQQSMSPIGAAYGGTFQSDRVRPGSYVVFAASTPMPATADVMRVLAKQGKAVTIAESSQQSVTLTLIDNDALYQALINWLQNPTP